MELRIHRQAKTRVPAKALKTLFATIAAGEAKSSWSADVNLIFTRDRQIRRLNAEYRKKDKATDVLSFTIDDPKTAGGTFGEVYISCDTARRQAAEYGSTLVQEYLRLACHGLLHLFGYDHVNRQDAQIMRKLEAKYLRCVGGDAA